MVSAMSLGEYLEFNPFIEFAHLFLATTPTSCHPSELSTTESARNLTLHGYQDGDPHPPNSMPSSPDSSVRKMPQAAFIAQSIIPM